MNTFPPVSAWGSRNPFLLRWMVLAWLAGSGWEASVADARGDGSASTTSSNAGPHVWVAETLRLNDTPAPGPILQSPMGIAFDGKRRPVIVWVESSGAGGDGAGWWARYEDGVWRTHAISSGQGTGVFSIFAGKGGAALAVASNGVPYTYHTSVIHYDQGPYYLPVRTDLSAAPAPGVPVGGAFLSSSLNLTFDADGRYSNPPQWAWLADRGMLRLNGTTDLIRRPIDLGNAARLHFRQGPAGRVHLLYQTADGMLRYNGGGPDADRPILLGNTGSSAYSLAVDSANGIHVSAAQGTGRFFFGAVGRLVYLHSTDGITWTTNAIPNVAEDVGATAIALDSSGYPAVAFTRAFSSLFFTRFDGKSWSVPEEVRSGLGGWDFSRDVRFAFDDQDIPHIVVADRLSQRLLHLTTTREDVPTDLAIASVLASTNRAVVSSQVALSVTLTNAGPRNAAAARLWVRLAPELVVRDVVPRPTEANGSTYRFDLGTVQALAAPTFRFTVSSLDPARTRVEAWVETETADANSANDSRVAEPARFWSSPCFSDPRNAGCDDVALLPLQAAPALANEPWSMIFRAPSAALGSELRIAATNVLPPGFCLTAEGELRGPVGAAGTLPLTFDLVDPEGRITTFERPISIVTTPSAAGPAAFWSFDGHGLDSVAGTASSIGSRATFVPGVVGSALQSARDALNDPRVDLAKPGALWSAPTLFDGKGWGPAPVTISAWVRVDGAARSQGDGRRYGSVFGLDDRQDVFRARFVAFDPSTGRLNILSGPTDFRADVLPGPVLSAGVWHHLAWVNDGLNAQLYTNGVLAVSGRFRQALPDLPLFTLGGEAFGGSFSGAIDEVALYRATLAPDAVVASMQQPLPRRRPLPANGEFPIAPMMRELVLGDAPQGEPYEATLVHAFCGTPAAFRLIHGALPAGLTMSNEGVLRGASTVAGVSRFRVMATDANGAAAELAVRLTTRPGLPVFTLQPADTQVEAGGLLWLAVETRAEASLQWFFNDRPISGEIGSILALQEFSQAQVGRYRVRASNETGSTWSREVRVTLKTQPDRPPTVDVAPVALRPDGIVRIRVETLRGRLYELQRAVDLTAALSGGWQLVKRFVATDVLGTFDDFIPGRPNAAFYRVVEIVPGPASAFSLEDSGRFVGVASDGKARPGLLPSVDAQSGRLGPFEFRVSGATVPLDQGLVVRFPQGAQPMDRDGATALRFRQGELFFGDASPVQLDERGSNRVTLSANSDLELPAGPLSVETLERLLGKPAGSGIGLTFFRHFRFRLVSGVFDGDRIRDARLAWADMAAVRIPTPERTGNYANFDIELSATRLRLPFHGEFALEDASGAPAKITVSPNRPIWVELRPGPEIAMGGRGKVSFREGPEFTVDFTFDDPVFRGSMGARKLRLPEGLTLRSFLSRLPVPQLPGPPPPAARQLASTSSDYLKLVQGRARETARKSCATSSAARELLADAPPRSELQDPGLEASDDEIADTHFTDRALAELRAWSCVAEAYGGVDRVPEPTYVYRLIERFVSSAVTDSLPGSSRSAELGAMTYAFRAAVLAEVAHMATLYPPEMADTRYVLLAVTDPQYAGLMHQPNPRLQPYVDWAFEAFEALSASDPSAFDTTSLVVAARALAKVIAAANRNTVVIPPARAEAMQRTFEELLRARGVALQRELGVERGQYSSENNAIVSVMHRWEAMAYLRQALRINQSGQLAGVASGSLVAPEVLTQLASQTWLNLRTYIEAVTNQCTAPAYYTVLSAAAEIEALVRVTDELDLTGRGVSLPTRADIFGYAQRMERACAEARPPVTLTDLYVRANPGRADEGRVLAVEGRLKLLTVLPTEIRGATPEVLEALAYAKAAFDPLFVPTNLPPIEAFRPGLILRTLRAGLMFDNLRRRFRLPADTDWLNVQLPGITRVARRKLREENLEAANRLLTLAAWRPKENPTQIRARGNLPASVAASRSLSAEPDPDDAPEDLERRYAYLQAAIDVVQEEENQAVTLAEETGIDALVTDVVSHLADLRLPGGLTVEEASGEITFHTAKRELSGSFRGALQIPGAGLRLNLNRADFSTGGSFSGELFGSLALPPTRPVATLSIPSSQPARLRWARGTKPVLSGGGRLALANGATFEAFLSLEDPVYRFGASARGLRFQFSRAALESLGLPLATALNATTAGPAIEYLTRAGLVLEGLQPAQDTTPTFDRLRPTEVRPLASDADDLAAGAAALWLLTHPEGSGATASLASGTSQAALPPDSVTKGRALLTVFVEQLARATASLSSDALSLSDQADAIAWDAAPVPASEAGTLRNAKVVEAARRVREFGQQFSDIATELQTERGRQLTGSGTEKTQWETQLAAFLRAYRDVLSAARDRLLDPVNAPPPGRAPWRAAEAWDRTAATNLLTAAQRYELTVQSLGVTDPSLLRVGAEVSCAVFQVLVEERFESLGLDPVSGAAAASGGALAVHLGLDRDQAAEGLAAVLQLEAWNQGSPFCSSGNPPERLTRTVAVMAQRARELAVQDLQSGLARVRATARRSWEEAEFVQSAANRLFTIFDVPDRLGLMRYPSPTFALTPRSPNEQIQDVHRDVGDLFELLSTALNRLAALSQDEASGYPAELRRRKAVPLPAAGPLARLLARYADLPGVSAARAPLARLAVFEAELLQVQTADPSFATRLGRDAAALVNRVLNAARLLDASSSGGAGQAQAGLASVSAIATLTDTVLARIQAVVRSNTQLPWWVSAASARELQQAAAAGWNRAETRARWVAASASFYEVGRDRVNALLGSRIPAPASDLSLPGDLEITRVHGSLVLNRETRYVLFEIGGRLDFPSVRTAGGGTAFLELERLRLESTGQFAFAAAARAPLVFADASFAGGFRASGSFPTRALSLAGEGTLTFVNAPTNPESGQPFPTQLRASASYEPSGFDDQGRPVGWRFAFGADGSFRQSFGKDFALFGAGAGFVVGRSAQGNPIGGVSVGGSVGLFRKAERRLIEPPAPSDFHVLVENAGVEIVGTVNEGGYAAVTNGNVRLPDFFYPTVVPPEIGCDGPGVARVGTTAAIQSPVRVRYAQGDKPRLEGTLRFSHFGVRLGGTNLVSNTATNLDQSAFASLTVCQADLGIDTDGWPFLDIPRAGLGFNIPAWDRGLVRLQNVRLGLDGQVRGELFLVEDFNLVQSEGLELAILGAPAYADPNTRPPTGCRGTGLTLEEVPGFAQPRITLSGGVRVLFPLDFISNTNGTRAGGFFCGGVRIEPTADGPRISAFVDELGLAGDFRMGRTGFRLRNARIGAGNFGGILSPDAERPFYFALSGDLQAGPFIFGLNNAQVRYRGPSMPPAFGLEQVRFSRDPNVPLPAPFSLFPVVVEFAELRFQRPSAPIAEMFAPQNLQITTSLRVGLPTVEKAFVGGGVSGVVFRFREDGTPIPPAIDGIDLTMSSGAGLSLPAFGDLGGKIRLGGFRRAIADPNRLRPEHIYAVGQLGATQQGVRLGFLAAFNLLGPIGMCLDVNIGAAGIVLAPTPFQITGASGGIALLQAENPCDFAQYFEFDPTTGTYQLKQNVEVPAIGMPWQQFADTLEQMAARIQGFASRIPTGALPGAELAGAAEAHPDLVGESHAVLSAESQPSASVNSGGGGGAVSAFPPGTFSQFGCPEECPPKTVAILCQPHPDAERFPNRVIFKFSSITESTLTNPPPAGLGFDVAALRVLGADSARVGGEVASRLVNSLRSVVPVSAVLPAEVQAFLREQERIALEGVRVAASNGVKRAVAGSPDVYGAVRDELYRGVGCPDISLSLAGRMSLVGLSAFGWVEGRETTAFSGSGGVVGDLYALGVPVGEARVFISTTDAQGLPNPSVCGQVKAGLGPFDFGKVDLALRCEGCVTEFVGMFPRIARLVGPAFLRIAVERVAPDLAEFAADPEVFLSMLQSQPLTRQRSIALTLVSELMSADPALLPGNLGPGLRDAFADAWDRINPQLVLCGEVTPRFLGLPLTLGGRSLGLNFLGDKTRVIGEMAFAPSSFVPLFPPGDEASLSFAYRVADPLTLLLHSLDGSLSQPQSRAAFIREQAESLLENMAVAARYQWHPFGLELGDAAARFILPNWLDHPAIPGSTWRNPDTLASSGVPTRDEVLVQAAASGKLGLAFEWLGTPRDFGDIFAPGDPRREVAQQRQLDLRRSYFPHGGLVGGARMALPRLLMVAPSEWQPLYHATVDGTNLFEQAQAAITLIQEFILKTETNGTAAFYTPAPNPPLLYDRQGQLLSAAEIQRRLAQQPDDFSPEGLARQLRGLDPGAAQSLAHLYPDELSFLRAEMTNLTLMGMPVFGTARMTGKPSPLRLLDGAPLARLDVHIDSASPIGKVAGQGFDITFDIHATPAQSLVAWAQPLLQELRSRPAPLVFERLRAGLARQVPRFAATNTLPPLSVVDPREWAAGNGIADLLSSGGGGFGGGGFPGFGGVTSSSRGGSLPQPSPPLLRAELSLYAFSPLYDPEATGEGPVVEARRNGGLAAAGALEILPELPSRSGSGRAELSVTVVGNRPRLAGRILALNLSTPFAGLRLQNARADFDSQANTFLRANTTLPEMGLGPVFRLRPAQAGSSLNATFALSRPSTPGVAVVGLPRASLELAPAQLTSDFLSGALLIHGAGNLTNPVVLGEGSWTARASLVASSAAPALQQTGTATTSPLTLRADLGGVQRDVVRVTGLPAAAFVVRGSSPQRFVAALDATLSDPITLQLFPGASVVGLPSPSLRIRAPANGSVSLEFRSDGTFQVEGELAADFNSGVSGLFAAGARVRVDPSGATISGNVGGATGTLQVGWFDGRLESRFGGQLTFPPVSVLGGRVTLAAADGGNMTATVDPSGTCVSGAVLTLQNFGAAPAVRLTFPRFCLTADRTFANLAPSGGAEAALQSTGSSDLGVGAFLLGNLRALKLGASLSVQTLQLDFEADLKLGSLLNVPVRGSVGSAGLRFLQNATTTRLLGFDFADLRLGATNAQGDLPEVGFVGRIPALPVGLANLDLVGRIPGTGGFSLLPAQTPDLAGLIPSFPLSGVRPAFQYAPGSYDAVVRSSKPTGYWPLGDTSGEILDQRLAKFLGSTSGAGRRSGSAVGNVTRDQAGAFDPEANRGLRFDGGSAHVRFDHDTLAPRSDRFSVSLWFRRSSPQTRAAPRPLAARGGQWLLALREFTPGEGTRLQFGLNGPTQPDGGALPWLVGRTRLDDTEWHHAVAVFDGAAEYLYLDGKLDAWQATRGDVAAETGTPTTLGAQLQGSTVANAFAGWLDEVAVFNAALTPSEVLAQWIASGRAGVSLDGNLVGDALPGLPTRAISGLLAPNGDAVVSLQPGGISEFAGVRLRELGATLFRQGTRAAATFGAELVLPQLDAAALGGVRGVFDSEGTFTARASSLVDRGVFGWQLVLRELSATGDWRARRASVRLTGRLALPHNIASLDLSGDINPSLSQYKLIGAAGGAFQFGSKFPFAYSVAPELTETKFLLPGRITLGTASDAASFGTRLEITTSGSVSASFAGLTPWVSFVGVGHGRMQWTGELSYDGSGFPDVAFRGRLGLATPQHPESIDDLPEGVGILVSNKPRITASLRNPDKPITVTAQGRATIQAEPAFQGQSFFPFELR